MSLGRKYDRRLKSALNLHAVFEPGTEMKLGDVLMRRDGIFTDVSSLSEFGVRFKRVRAGERSLSFDARGVRVTAFQGGVEVPVHQIDGEVRASLEVRFERRFTYFLRTPKLTGQEIDNLLQVGRAVRDLDDWRFGKYYIAIKALNAGRFTFLGSNSRNRMVKFTGSGKAVKRLLDLGATAGLTVEGSRSVDVKIIGKGGPVAIGVARIRRDGTPVIV